MSPTPFLTVPTVSCCLVKPPRVNTPLKLVRLPHLRYVVKSDSIVVKMMAETAYLAESAICYPPLFDQLRQLTPRPTETAETLAMSAVAAAIEQDAGAIIVLSTRSVLRTGFPLDQADLYQWCHCKTHLQVQTPMPHHLWYVAYHKGLYIELTYS
jgi:hypothetical protein